MTRRDFLLGGTAAVALASGATALWRMGKPAAAVAAPFEISKTDEEWRALLTPEQFAVLRQEDTEPAGSSPLNNEKRKGIFHCAGCDLAAYSSEAKYESETGWPSFWQSLPDAIGTKEDNTLFMTRTEVHCRRCGGHFGHIFDDGPPPTGKRHCLNGLALTFKPATA
ncbi:peptide-methionine (R)-S-oxide reductase MsrB [Pseudaminobacter sp. NGMCC 1.201702]|uniref:peptide-methionine (R)-S-oxide reductase MsrB n=1 Tax=Pseudaminobacter sp. NGMCC 1.201702 TaxID=3391825 RepID=UPI0039EFE7D7